MNDPAGFSNPLSSFISGLSPSAVTVTVTVFTYVLGLHVSQANQPATGQTHFNLRS